MIDDELVETTPEHPFYTQEDWVPAGDLWIGARIRKADGQFGVVQGLGLWQQPQLMYNLIVAGAHTFFVGDNQWLVHNTCSLKSANRGRTGKQTRLRQLADDPKVSSADRGWIKQEINSIKRGNRTTIRVPIGKDLAHRRGYEARKGFSYMHSDLQDRFIHWIQNKWERRR